MAEIRTICGGPFRWYMPSAAAVGTVTPSAEETEEHLRAHLRICDDCKRYRPALPPQDTPERADAEAIFRAVYAGMGIPFPEVWGN